MISKLASLLLLKPQLTWPTFELRFPGQSLHLFICRCWCLSQVTVVTLVKRYLFCKVKTFHRMEDNPAFSNIISHTGCFFFWNWKYSIFSPFCLTLSPFLLLSCLRSALPFLWSLSPCLHCLFALFNHQTNVLWHAPIAHRHRRCQQPQKATFSLALLPLPACSHSDSPRKHCICHRLWLMALLIAVPGHHHTYTFCF